MVDDISQFLGTLLLSRLVSDYFMLHAVVSSIQNRVYCVHADIDLSLSKRSHSMVLLMPQRVRRTQTIPSYANVATTAKGSKSRRQQ